MEIAICSCCGYPVIFRNWGEGNPHQPIHLPTGWPCWKLRETGECGDPESLDFEWTTPDQVREPKVDEAKKLYLRYERTGQMRDLLELVASELAADRADVVQDLLEYVATEVTDKPARSSFVKQVVASEGWQQLRQRLEDRGKLRRSPSRRRR
jgi:hypothetical protein